MKLNLRILFAGACVLAGGCLPEKRIVWSPDGKTAVVATDTGLRFIDSEFRVLPAKIDGESLRASWFHDGRRLAVVHPVEVSKWDELTSVLTPDQIARIKASADPLRQRILKYDGDWDKFEIDPDKNLTPGIENALLLYVRDKADEGIPEKMGDKWKTIAEFRPSISQLEIYEYSEREAKSGKVLVRSLEQILVPAASPDGSAVAYLRRTEQNPEALAGLFVVSTSGGSEVRVAENVAMGFDWSVDSKSIAYIHAPLTTGGDSGQLQLGALSTSAIKTDMPSALGVSQTVDHAGLIFNEALQVHCLEDGRLMFSSVEVNLPATARDMPQRWSIFLLDPKYPSTIQRLLARDYTKGMEMADQRFALSPDNRRVALLGHGAEVNIYDFTSGETFSVESPDGFNCASFPTWRNNAELIFARAPAKESEKVGEVVVWQSGKDRIVSTGWPADMTNWLKKAD